MIFLTDNIGGPFLLEYNSTILYYDVTVLETVCENYAQSTIKDEVNVGEQ